MTVLPLWCASTLVAYILGQALLGPTRGFASLVMLGGFASAALLALAGHPLPGIIVGAVSGGVSGALLVRWTGMLEWRAAEGAVAAEPKESAPSPAPEKTEAAPAKAKAKAKKKPASESPGAKAAAARTGGHAAAKSGKKSKRKKKKKAERASMEEASEVPVGRMLEETQEAVDQTAALGTVSRAGRTVAGFDAPTAVVAASKQKALQTASSEPPGAPEEVAERLGKRPSSIPRGVFAMDDETPIALTIAKTPSAPARDPRAELTISGFADPTENLDGEIAPTHCPRCRAVCAPEARYCAGCSAPVMPWSCKECGHENHAEADFCVRCQAPVELLASPVDVEILE